MKMAPSDLSTLSPRPSVCLPLFSLTLCNGKLSDGFYSDMFEADVQEEGFVIMPQCQITILHQTWDATAHLLNWWGSTRTPSSADCSFHGPRISSDIFQFHFLLRAHQFDQITPQIQICWYGGSLKRCKRFHEPELYITEWQRVSSTARGGRCSLRKSPKELCVQPMRGHNSDFMSAGSREWFPGNVHK